MTTLWGQGDFRWRDVTQELGITTPNRLPLSGRYRLPELFTGHAVPFDFDRDGDLDLLLTHGPYVADSLYSGLNHLFRHDDTAWVDISAASGLSRFPPAGNAAVGDVDGDGYLDLYLCLFGSDLLLRNNDGRFWTDITASMGLRNDSWATDAVFFDANHDGYLDLYVANYVDYPSGDTLICIDPKTRQWTYCDPLLYDPAPDRLFVNDNARGFHEMTAEMGMADTTSRSLAVELLEANGDGYLDLFVLSQGTPNLMYLSRSDSGFVEAGLFSGVALAPDGSIPDWSQVQVFDADQDGHSDLLFTGREGRIQLLLNDGQGLFFPGHYQTGLFHPRFPYRATTAAATDLDFNGTIDLLLADHREAVRVMEAADTASVDTSMAVREPYSGVEQFTPRRILLHDAQHYLPLTSLEVPMLLDTILLRPRVTVMAEEDTGFGTVYEEVSGPFPFPLEPGEDPLSLITSDLTTESAMGAMTDSVMVGDERALIDELPRSVVLDTIHVRQEAERYIMVDLTGDGVREVIATYSAGLYRVWKRELKRSPRFIGIWPQTERPGTTIIGAELQITMGRILHRIIVTDPNPILLYSPRRLRAVDVMVHWPDGLENHYRTSMLNRVYTLTRVEQEPEAGAEY
ncbi:MAG: VCBS repeat-containing protein [Fidelibacterota bacterium]|nr:MAG: VCBS repeat-containing protein [Candidatus Neomarinimicrobiota bacterium]